MLNKRASSVNTRASIKPTECDGTLGNCNDKQLATQEEFRNHVDNVMKINDTCYDDWFLLRFCRARKFKLKDVITMFENYIQWINKEEVYSKIAIDFSCFDEIRKTIFQHGYYGITKEGRPLYIERYNKLDVSYILKNFSEKKLVDYYINSYQLLLHCIFPECSRVAGKMIDKTCTILDIKGFNVSKVMGGDTQKFQKLSSQIAQDYYPELLGKLFIINTNWLFSVLWGIAKVWIDKKTKKKIKIIGGSYKKDLLADIDEDQLPEWLGGTATKELYDKEGQPWTEYEKVCYAKQSYFADGVRMGYTYKEPERKAENDKLNNTKRQSIKEKSLEKIEENFDVNYMAHGIDEYDKCGINTDHLSEVLSFGGIYDKQNFVTTQTDEVERPKQQPSMHNVLTEIYTAPLSMELPQNSIMSKSYYAGMK